MIASAAAVFALACPLGGLLLGAAIRLARGRRIFP